ncbi:hypothetical protein KIM372_06610 [Bombiscardovia nodaiensis]|uniref:Uncharacterized protein n=1 Tax=Bombiscardovia nodaiensis TaxID=2932181 RepID=A0ABN6S9E0_9BIFI|nr:hypothetical protein KIM372_06610 [Bombiscardovia nodaiensis]
MTIGMLKRAGSPTRGPPRRAGVPCPTHTPQTLYKHMQKPGTLPLRFKSAEQGARPTTSFELWP